MNGLFIGMNAMNDGLIDWTFYMDECTIYLSMEGDVSFIFYLYNKRKQW